MPNREDKFRGLPNGPFSQNTTSACKILTALLSGQTVVPQNKTMDRDEYGVYEYEYPPFEIDSKANQPELGELLSAKAD